MKFVNEPKKRVGLLVLTLGLAVTWAAMQAFDRFDQTTLAPTPGEGGSPGFAHTVLAKTTPSAPPNSSEREASDNPLAATAVASLGATQERPLFSSSRRPPAPTATPVQPLPMPANEPRRPTLSLVGVVAGEGEAFAIFLEEKTKAVVRLKAGESHAGWTLRGVGRREATLERGRESEVLAIILPAAR